MTRSFSVPSLFPSPYDVQHDTSGHKQPYSSVNRAVHRDRKLLNADVTWEYPFDLKSVELIQKHINKCEQRIIQELNGVILLKLRNE